MPDQKPWERDWSGVTPDATGGKKPWERDWSGTSTPNYKPSEDDWGLREFLLGGSKGPGGSFAKATQALPESVAGVVRGAGHAVMHPIETGQALWDEVLGGFPKLREDYGSPEAALKKFEKDPAGFLLDFYTAGRGSAGVARKGTELGIKGTRKLAPTVLGATSKASAEDLRRAGEAAREGGMTQAEYARGRAGEPLLSERQPVTHEAGVISPIVADLPMRKQLEAREALGRQREAAQAALRPYGEAGRRLGEKGADPAAIIAAGLAGGRIGTAIAAGAGSPRTAGAIMQGLGGAERRLAGRPLMTRADIAAAAADLLKDKEQKKQLQPHEPKILRQARRSDASSVTLQRAQQILAGRTPQMRIETGFADLPDYGGTSGDVPSRQEGGPVTARKTYSVGDAPGASADTPKPETFIPDAPKDYDYAAWQKANPGVTMSPGQHYPDTYKLPNHPTFSNESIYSGKEGAEGGKWSKNPDGSWNFTPGKTNLEHFTPQQLQDYFQRVEPGNHLILPQSKDPRAGEMIGSAKLWDMILEGGKDLSARLKEAGRAAFFEPEAYDPSAPLEAATLVTGGRMPFARAGELGVGGGKLGAKKLPAALYHVVPGRAYSVGDAPGATPGTPKPETFIPDRGPSPAQAAGGAATEAVGWVSDAWASILKGEKPPPLPGLPEAGKVPSTADPRPTQALGEQTSFLSQLAGPPGAAAAKGLGAAALGAAAGKGLLKGVAEEGAEMAGKGIRAYHGSPYNFPKFSTEKIGTGEGAQAYGHGLYFAEHEGVAREYKNKLADPKQYTVPMTLDGRPVADRGDNSWVKVQSDMWDKKDNEGAFLAQMLGDANRYNVSSIGALKKLYQEQQGLFPWNNPFGQGEKGFDAAFKALRKRADFASRRGHMYEVNIKAEREHFLDWDKPLSEQSKHVQDKLKELNLFPNPERIEKMIKERQKAGMEPSKYLSEKLADEQKRLQMPASQLHWEMGPKGHVANQLKEAGIPGIKYLDQGSRAEGGTSNFVVFNDALIDIVRKYGIAAIAAIPPALALKNEASSR